MSFSSFFFCFVLLLLLLLFTFIFLLLVVAFFVKNLFAFAPLVCEEQVNLKF